MRRLLSIVSLAFACVPPTAFAAAPGITSLAAPYPKYGSVERLDPALDALLPAGAQMEKLAEGFSWIEGPVWLPREQALLFSDMIHNVVYRWKDGEGVSVFLRPAGFTGAEPDGDHQGPNGLLLDREGRLLICQQGDRRIARLNAGFGFTPVVERYQGRRFNSPNDLVLDRAGNLFFTDPPYGFGPRTTSELGFSGVFRVTPAGEVTLLTREFARPNGIGLSPDEKTLYVSSSEEGNFGIFAFALHADGTVGVGRRLFDATPFSAPDRPGSTDGMAIDALGNLWTTAPGGVFVLSPEGKRLGVLHTGQPNGNCVFGGDDGSTLFIMSNHAVVRIHTGVKGLGL